MSANVEPVTHEILKSIQAAIAEMRAEMRTGFDEIRSQSARVLSAEVVAGSAEGSMSRQWIIAVPDRNAIGHGYDGGATRPGRSS